MNEKNNNNNKKNNTRREVDEDYLDLLSEFNKKSASSQNNAEKPKRDYYEDFYSDSSGKAYSVRESLSESKIKANERGVYISEHRNTRPSEQGAARNTERTADLRQRQADRNPNRREYTDVYSDSSEEYAPWRRPNAAPEPPPLKKRDPDEISDHEARRKKKKRKKARRVIALLLAFVLVLFGVGFFSVMGVVGKFTKAEHITHYDGEKLIGKASVKNILLIGLDKAQGGTSRSDSIMICSLNPSTGKVVMTSVLRDTHLDIPGECEAKVNSAYARGGADLLVQTLEKNFGIKIDGYACVNFEMFTALIDGLGGIDIEVTEDEADYINNRHNYKGARKPDTFESGESVHLNGYQALWYSRIRKLDSDFMRTSRQRKVLTSVAGKIKSQLSPAKLPELMKTARSVAPYVETTLSAGEFFGIAVSAVRCLVKSGADIDKMLVSQKIPFDDTWQYANKWDGSSIVIDLEKNREMLYSSIYEGAQPDAPQEN